MADDSSDASFALRQVFLGELRSGYQAAREAFAQLVDLAHGASAQPLSDFFHRVAGTAKPAGFPELGGLAAMAERVADWLRSDSVPKAEALLAMGGALDAIDELLSREGPIRPARVEAVPVRPGLAAADESASKVMVVDDDALAANLAASCLREAGFKVAVCTEPERAAEAVRAELPDLLILDVLMPGIDGFELCRRLRAQAALSLTPILFLTRKDDVEERVRGLEAGGNDYLAKPFAPAELVARVRSHLQRLSVLREMATRDSLTRCFNQRYFKLRLEQEIARARRYRTELALGLLDIDHFKQVNDTHGHPVGDWVLAHLADLVTSSLRSTDLVARYGGEEFGLLLVHAGGEEATVITERIRERIAHHPFTVPSVGAQVPVTVSVGVAELTPSDDVESLLRRADQALYEAKRAGRNQVALAR